MGNAEKETCQANQRSYRDAIVRIYTEQKASGKSEQEAYDEAVNELMDKKSYKCPSGGTYTVEPKKDSNNKLTSVNVMCRISEHNDR